jgi:gas vesicle protein GvpL/GvpF
MSLGLCAYAITRDHDLDLPDLEIRLIARRGLGLVVADVELTRFTDLKHATEAPAEDDPLAVLARRHDTVVRAVFERQPVLPLRFGTVLRDPAAAMRLLAGCHELAGSQLDRVDGHREWVVRAQPREKANDDTVRPDGLSGTEYLALRRKRLATIEDGRRRRAGEAAALHATLAQHAVETAPRPRRSPALLLDTAYLVPAHAEAALHAEIEHRRDTGGLDVAVTGPLPPYSFARLELSDRIEATAHA